MVHRNLPPRFLTSGATVAREREGRICGIEPVSRTKRGQGEKDEKSRRRKNATSASYCFFVSKHDANASLKKRAPCKALATKTPHNRSAYAFFSAYPSPDLRRF